MDRRLFSCDRIPVAVEPPRPEQERRASGAANPHDGRDTGRRWSKISGIRREEETDKRRECTRADVIACTSGTGVYPDTDDEHRDLDDDRGRDRVPQTEAHLHA